MTHKQWFNNVLHLHPVHEQGAEVCKGKTIKQTRNIINYLPHGLGFLCSHRGSNLILHAY